MSQENDSLSLPLPAENASELHGERLESEVARYLRQHPKFFAGHPELLSDLLQAIMPPSRFSGDGVIDMQRYVVESLRGEIAGLRDCANEVIETSRANLAIQTRTHAAVLALVAAPDVDHLLRAVSDDLPILLDVDVATLGVEPGCGLQRMIEGMRRFRSGDVDRLLGAGCDVALLREMSDDGTVFGAGAGLVRSAALARIRCGEGEQVGLLAFGCRGAGAFHPGQGTELLRFLAKIVEICLVRVLPVPA